MEFDVVPFDPLNDSDDNWQVVYDFFATMHKHVKPDDAREPDEMIKKSLIVQIKNPEIDFEIKGIFETGKRDKMIGTFIFGYFTPDSPSYEGNKALAITEITIIPEFRRRGIATILLNNVYEKMVEKDKMVAIGNSEEKDGKLFTIAIGGQIALTNIENRAYLKKIDWEMIENWASAGERKSPNSRMMFFTRVPDDILKQYCEMYTETLNQVPLGELAIEDQIVTPETMRKSEEERAELGREKITAIVIEENGDITAMSEFSYSPTNNTTMGQGLTSTVEKYRGRGIGKWIKAAMLLKARERYPTVKYISTHNATSNAPMLSINERVGFKKHKEVINVQIMRDKLAEFMKK